MAIKVPITGDNAQLKRVLNDTQRAVHNTTGKITKDGKDIDGFFSKMGKTFDNMSKNIVGGLKSMTMGVVGFNAAMSASTFITGFVERLKSLSGAMREVSTISKDVTADMEGYTNKVLEMTTRVPVAADESAKALYQIVSAGQQGADAMHVLEVSSKAAIAGVTDTATAADAITTVMNAYHMSAEQAQHVSDLLFTTVRLGKTTMAELGHSISAAAPAAAAFGVSIEELLASVATLTKSGVPTATAMTQINAVIQAGTKAIGDGAFRGRSFAEALEMIENAANGSDTALQAELGNVRALRAVLGLTGESAKMAAQDMEEMTKASGAASEAYEKMAASLGNQQKLLVNNITAFLAPALQGALSGTNEMVTNLNEAFASGEAQKFLNTLKELVITYGAYKGTLIAVNAINTARVAIMERVAVQMALAKTAGVAINTTEAAGIVIKNSATAAWYRLNAAMMANPAGAVAAAITALGVVVYKLCTYETDLGKIQGELNDKFNESQVKAEGEINKLDQLREKLNSAKKGTEEYDSVKQQIINSFGAYDSMLSSEIEKVGLTEDAYNRLAIAIHKSANARGYETFMQSQNDSFNKNYSSNLSKIQDIINGGNDAATASNLMREARDIISGKKALSSASAELKKFYGGHNAYQYIRDILIDQGNLKDAEKNARTRFGIGETPTIYKPGEKNEGKKEEDIPGTTAYELKKKEKEIKKLQAELRKKQREGRKDQKNAQSIADIEAQLRIKQSEYKIELAIKTKQAKIDAYKEGEKKLREQIALDYDKRKYEIDHEENELRRIAEEDARKLWEAKNAKAIEEGRTSWTSSGAQAAFLAGYSLTPEQEIYFKNARKANNAQKKNSLDELSKKINNYRLEYLKEYGNKDEQIKAINDYYDELLKDADDEWQKKSINKERSNTLGEASIKRLKKDVNWDKVFGDLDNLTNAQLSSVYGKLQAFINSDAFKQLGAEAQKAIMEAFDAITDENNERNPIRALKNAFKDLKAGSMQEVSKGYDAMAKRCNDIAEAWNSVEYTWKELGNMRVDGGVAGILGGLVGASSGISNAWKSFTKADIAGVVKGASQAVLGVGQTIGNLGGMIGVFSSADYKDYNNLVNEYTRLIGVWDQLISKKREYINESYGVEASKAGQEALDLINKQTEAYRKLGISFFNSGASTGSHSRGTRAYKNTSGSEWEEIAAALGVSVDSAKSMMGGRMTGLFELTSKQLEMLKENAYDWWAGLEDNVQQYLDAIISGSENAESIMEQVNKQLTATDFSSVQSSFKNLLTTMTTTGQDWANNFEDMIRNAVINGLMETYNSELQEWYNNFAAAMESDGLDEGEKAALLSKYKDIAERAEASRDALYNILDIADSSGTAQSTINASMSITEDTANELVGRMTAIQIGVQNLINNVVTSGEAIQEMRNLAITRNSYLEDIAKYGKLNYALLEQRLAEIKQNTDKL